MGNGSSVDSRRQSIVSSTDNDRLKTPPDGVFKAIADRCYPFQVSYGMIEGILDSLNTFKSARTKDIYPALEFLESFTSMSTHGKEIAEMWTNKLEKNNWVGIAMRLWPTFWKPDFIKALCSLKRDQSVPKDLQIVAENFVYFCAIFLNGSDSSRQFCWSLVKQGVIEELVKLVAKKEFDPSNTMKVGLLELDYIIHCASGIIHNAMRYYPVETKQRFRAADGVKTFQRLLQSQNAMVCTSAAFSLAYGINETEIELIKTEKDIFHFIIEKILGPCFENKNHRAHGFSAQETMEALNALSANDNNNIEIVNHGALPWYFKALSSPETDGELEAAAIGFWIFSFKQENVQQIKHLDGCLAQLDKLKSHKNWTAARAAKGALWNIRGKIPVQPKGRARSADGKEKKKDKNTGSGGSGGKKGKQQHVMISYDHQHKETVKLLNTSLQDAGYLTWFDEDKMKGNTLEAMAEAVEDAAVVLVCISDRYKQSPSCRTEAEYAYRLQKDIIPIRTEYRYVADGWLGILMGTKLYFDCFSTDLIQDCCDRVIKELGSRGKLGAEGAPVRRNKPQKAETGSSAGAEGWNNQQVRRWLQECGLGHLGPKFSAIDGALLIELKAMYQKSPTVFYQKAEQGLGLHSLPDLLKFTKNIDKLQ